MAAEPSGYFPADFLPVRIFISGNGEIPAPQIEQQRQLENSPYIEIIYQFASLDILQFFFEDLKDGFRVYLLDENNKLMSFIYLKLSKESFVAQINKKVADSNEDERGSSAKFGLPQFYQLNNENGEISVSTYS